jgi:uncharacterized protein DUF4351
MLEETIREWHRKARKEGLLDGTRQTVLRLVERRFGPVTSPVRARIEALSSVRELNQIADRILTAGSLREMGLE